MARHSADRWVSAFAALAICTAASPAASLPVDIELVVAVDASRSVNDDEYALQVGGYAKAFTHPAVLRAITGGRHRAIAVTYVQWAGPLLQQQLIGWTLINDRESAEEFAERVLASPRAFRGGGTSLSGIIDYSRPLFDRNGFEGERRVVDISGDGINNSGRLPHTARDDAVLHGTTINGLPILNEVPWLDDYFRDNVIGGAGAFLIAAQDYDSFAIAIRNKLIREIAGEESWPGVAERAED